MIQRKAMTTRELKAQQKAQEKQAKLIAKKLAAKKESQRLDCLNEKDVRNIDKALRKVWSWSHARRLVVKRCDIGEGYSRCEGCKKKCPKVFVDHIKAVGTFDLDFIDRLFVPSSKLQGLCAPCHKVKTKSDLEIIKSKRREMVETEAVDYDFF